MTSDAQAFFERFTLVFCGDAAAEIEDGIIIVQRQGFQEGFQFSKACPDLQRIGLVGLGLGLVHLIQHGFTIAVPRIKGMGIYVGFQLLCDFIHVDFQTVAQI